MHFSIDNLAKFAQAVLDGKMEAYMKSEPIPDDNSQGVKVERFGSGANSDAAETKIPDDFGGDSVGRLKFNNARFWIEPHFHLDPATWEPSHFVDQESHVGVGAFAAESLHFARAFESPKIG